MGLLKNKCLKASVLIVLCQSPYFYFICSMTVIKSKNIDEQVNLICLESIDGNNSNSNSSNCKWLEYVTCKQNSEESTMGKITQESVKIDKQPPKQRNRRRIEEERIICEGILAMDMHNNTKNNNSSSLVIPLNLANLASLGVLFILILFGSYYVWKIITRKKCKCKVCKNEYKIVDKLGEGGFGEIYKVEKKGVNYILKRCKTENITEADDILLEAKYLRNLEHKNIVKYIDDFIHVEIHKGKLEPTYYVLIIMEFCEGGDLKKQIDSVYYDKRTYTKHEILEVLIQICEGLNYLHNRNIIHRDIKSQNIFLTKNGVIRIGDFGLAKKLKKNNRHNTYMTKVGTDCYMAPEIMQGEKYGKPADIWSLGCVIHELCTLNFMWMHDTSIGINILTKKDFQNTFLEEISEPDHDFFKNLLIHIFVTNPDKRIRTDTLLKKLKKEKNLSMRRNT